MHLPDGILDVKTTLATGLLAATGVGVALRTAQQTLPAKRVPLLGVTAAFLFAAQMLNFPVLPGVSGHLCGGALAVLLLGPAGAVVALTAVLVLQCYLLQDGGVTALGANTLNLALATTMTGWLLYRLARPLGRAWAAGVAGWGATVVSSLCCAAQLAWSGTASWQLVFPALVGVHAVIGVGEGVITALIIGAIAGVRPELVETDATPPLPALALVLVVAVGLAWFVSPFTCAWPDGLQKVASTLGFEHAPHP